MIGAGWFSSDKPTATNVTEAIANALFATVLARLQG
jgi:hypothetical protein